MALKRPRIRSIIESMLIVSSEPLPVARIVEVVQGEDKNTKTETIKGAIADLIAAYGKPDRKLGQGFRIDDVAGGLQIRSTAENAAYLRRLLAMRPQRLTKPALETLAIISPRQPTTKPEIEKVRGVDCSATIKALLERDLIRILGKSDEVGRPILYGTTSQFLELFGKKGTQFPSVKLEFVDGDKAEYLWVNVLSADESGGVGRVDNIPVNLTNLKIGQRVAFRRPKIADWVCYVGDKRHGGFTIEVFERAQAKAIAERKKATSRPQDRKGSGDPAPGKGKGGGPL